MGLSANLSESVLKKLFPPGSPWSLKGQFGNVVRAIAATFGRAYEFAAGVVDESLPSTVTDTFERWFDRLGIIYDPTQTTETKRRKIRQSYTAVGGQDKAYIEGVLQEAYPDLSLAEPDFTTDNMTGIGMVGEMQTTDYASWVPAGAQDGSYPVEYYRVVGQVESTYDRNGAQAILDRIAPAHLSAVFDIEILNATKTSEVGLAVVGLAQVGRFIVQNEDDPLTDDSGVLITDDTGEQIIGRTHV